MDLPKFLEGLSLGATLTMLPERMLAQRLHVAGNTPEKAATWSTSIPAYQRSPCHPLDTP